MQLASSVAYLFALHSFSLMPLAVLNVAYPFAPVGPDAVGGAEQVLSQLDAALTRAGHRSVVVACEGSSTSGVLIETPRAQGMLTEASRQRVREWHRLQICEAIQRYRPDVVHLHGIDFFEYLPPSGPPALVTLHLPPSWYPPAVWNLRRPRTYLHCVSAAQQRACPPGAKLLEPIENGVDVDTLSMRCRRRRFAMAMGRICPEKNFHVALDAAAAADMPLLLAGEVFPYEAHERYFRECIVPRLDRHRRFIGPIGWRRKRRLLSAATCLLLPSLAEETSSLVGMEALACGTPVIAFPSGALPDIVEHGKTGMLVKSVQEMTEAIQNIHRISPQACRATARTRFSIRRTMSRYIAVYERLARGVDPGLCMPGETIFVAAEA